VEKDASGLRVRQRCIGWQRKTLSGCFSALPHA
jgi:hypothetical protein